MSAGHAEDISCVSRASYCSHVDLLTTASQSCAQGKTATWQSLQSSLQTYQLLAAAVRKPLRSERVSCVNLKSIVLALTKAITRPLKGTLPGNPRCQTESKRVPIGTLLVVRLTFLLHGRLGMPSVCLVHASVHVVYVSDVVQRSVISSSQLESPAQHASTTF